MRDVALFGIFAVLLPICVKHPWIGVLVWHWVGLMNPHKFTWGAAYDFPFAQLVGIATLVGLLLSKDRKPPVWTREMVLVAVLFAYFTFTTFFAWVPSAAWELWEKVAKILVLVFIVPMLIYGPVRIRWLLLVAALSVGFFGIKGGIWVLSTGGTNMILGPRGGSFISSNTYIGLAFLMVAPVLVMLARTEPRRWLRMALYAAGALNFFSVPFTYSRGALLGLVVVLPLMFLRSRGKVLIALAAIPIVYFGQPLLPERLMNRTATIQEYQDDSSAMLRLQAWGVNYNIAKERPLAGGGFNLEYTSDQRWLSYADFLVLDGSPEINYARSAHSSYFQILGSHGFVALALFLGLLILTLFRLQTIKRTAERSPNGGDFAAYASGIQLGLVGYCVSGAFINAAYFDLFYLYVAMTAVLWRECLQDVRQGQSAPLIAVQPQAAPIGKATLSSQPARRVS